MSTEKNKVSIPVAITLISLTGFFILFTYISMQYTLMYSTIDTIVNGKITQVASVDYPLQKKIFEILANLAVTGFVGVLVSYVITESLEKNRLKTEQDAFEKRQKEKESEIKLLNESVNESVFDAIFKKMIPAPTFLLIKDQIIKSKAIRKNAHWFFNFTENNLGSLNLSQQLVYELENVSSNNLIDPIVLNTDKYHEFQLIYAESRIDGEVIFSFDAENDLYEDADGKKRSNNPFVEISNDENGNYRIEIKAEIPPHKTAEFTMEYVDTFKHDFFKDGYFTKYPLLDVLIKFNFPINWNLDVFLLALAKQPLLNKKPEAE